jgi:hypothetical protein
MSKSLDQLNLSDQPIRTPAPIDPRDTDWYRFAREIDDLLATGEYTWAEETLTDIQTTVERIQTVTQGQRHAVANIEAARQGRRDGPRGRRYEGFPGRRW